MKIIKCDVCGADVFDSKEMEKGKVIWVKRKMLVFIDICPNCARNGDAFYVK